MRRIKGVRWFSGKPFNIAKRVALKDKRKAKNIARRVADEHRDLGLKARVIKTRKGYDVYTTYKPTGVRALKIKRELIDRKKFLRKMK